MTNGTTFLPLTHPLLSEHNKMELKHLYIALAYTVSQLQINYANLQINNNNRRSIYYATRISCIVMGIIIHTFIQS